MNIPCRECVNPKMCEYRCRVTGKTIETCFYCIVYKELEANEKTIRELKNGVLEYKDKADKYDAIVKAYTEELLKTVAKVFAETLSLAD